jgi:hypothetical protein
MTKDINSMPKRNAPGALQQARCVEFPTASAGRQWPFGSPRRPTDATVKPPRSLFTASTSR